jgi:hypothetical protein
VTHFTKQSRPIGHSEEHAMLDANFRSYTREVNGKSETLKLKLRSWLLRQFVRCLTEHVASHVRDYKHSTT